MSELESLREACAKLVLHQTAHAEEMMNETNPNPTSSFGELSTSSSAQPSGEETPILFMQFPREIRDLIYPHVFGGYHIHIKGLNLGMDDFHEESMNTIFIETLRYYLDGAKRADVSRRIPMQFGYCPGENCRHRLFHTPNENLPKNDDNYLHHRICHRAYGILPKNECGGRCLDLARNNSQLSLGLLRTCRQVYEETRLIPYRLNSFEFLESHLVDFLRTCSPDQVASIRRLKVGASMFRCRMDVSFTLWVSEVLAQTACFTNLTSIMLHAKYVSANKNQLWMNGLLVTVPKGGLLCQVVLGQDEPGVNKYCWTTQCYDGEYGLRMPTPIAPRSLPGFVNLHPSAPVSLLSLHAYPQDVTGSLHPAAKHTNQTVWKKWKKWIKMKLFRGSG